MKTILKFWICGIAASSLLPQVSLAQSIDEARMTRDIAVAENVLATLIKHEMGSERTFFGLDIRGAYQPGYGVTFRLPPDHSMPFVVTITGDDVRRTTVISNGNGFQYPINANGYSPGDVPAEDDVIKLKEKSHVTADSVRTAYLDRVLKVAQDFILDYGDLISQLAPEERIVVTNQSDRPHFYFSAGSRSRISVEGKRQDITAFRQGKLSREQAIKRLSIINTQSIDVREPDMEMLSSIFSRLYRPDLSKSYFVDGNVYYERLRDFGCIFYMQMVSSIERNMNRFTLPTQGLEGLDQEARDKAVAGLYPAFEETLKENILEYGRTVKSLQADESLIFNISMTKCKGCAIPGTLELSIKSKVLEAFNSGRIGKSEAMGKFTVKRGAPQ